MSSVPATPNPWGKHLGGRWFDIDGVSRPSVAGPVSRRKRTAGGRRSEAVVLFLMAFLVGMGGAHAAPRTSAIQASMVLKVPSRDEAADALLARLEAIGGYFSLRTEESLVLKVPAEKVGEFLEYGASLGVVVERSFETQDLSFELEQCRTRLAGRKALLARYFEVLQGAGPKAVVTVEREITHMIEEIENLEGTIRLMEHRLGFAEVSVAFRFRDRAAPARDGRSSFRWLNSMNLVDLLYDFRSAR